MPGRVKNAGAGRMAFVLSDKVRDGSGIPRESEPPRRDRTWRSPGGSIS